MQRSVVADAWRALRIASRAAGVKTLLTKGPAWEAAKPSPTRTFAWDSTFIDELRRTRAAFKFFCFLPVYIICDTGLNTLFINMAAGMTTDGYILRPSSKTRPLLTFPTVHPTIF